MSFNDFITKDKTKIKTTSSVKFSQVLSSLSLNDVGIYPRDATFSSDIGIVNLHPKKGTHWVAYINENYFDSSGCICPKNLSKFNTKKVMALFLFRIQKTKSDKSTRFSLCKFFIMYNLLNKSRRTRF